MKLEDQVLSIKQIQELQELGFNVRKYSSIYYVPNWEIKWGEYEIQDYGLVVGELREEDIDCIPTLTIGDIIDILPIEIQIEIHKYVLVMNKKYIAYDDGTNALFCAYRRKFIDSLFDSLVWCIKQKYIEL